MRTITALFVGLGSIGTRHLKNLANLCADRGWTLQADALRSDLTRPLRPGAAELLHAQYTDLAAAPAHYDMVFITNPTSLHAEALRQVKGRGEALFIEKPIFSAEQTGLALDELLPAGQKAYVAAPMRWCGAMLALKDRLPALHPYCARVICSSYLPDWRPGVDYRTVYSARKALGGGVTIDLNRPMKEVLADLTKYPVSTRLLLNGTIIVARDIAHARIKERLDRGEGLPDYIKNHPVLYAGPAKTPEGYACGSMGPTTANRMDPYVDPFQAAGGSMVMIAKGNRTQVVTDACKKHGGFYLGTIGGVAAVLSSDCIKSIECIEYPELGMEAVYQIRVENFPAFILVDDKGNDFFQQLKPVTIACKKA